MSVLCVPQCGSRGDFKTFYGQKNNNWRVKKTCEIWLDDVEVKSNQKFRLLFD